MILWKTILPIYLSQSFVVSGSFSSIILLTSHSSVRQNWRILQRRKKHSMISESRFLLHQLIQSTPIELGSCMKDSWRGFHTSCLRIIRQKLLSTMEYSMKKLGSHDVVHLSSTLSECVVASKSRLDLFDAIAKSCFERSKHSSTCLLIQERRVLLAGSQERKYFDHLSKSRDRWRRNYSKYSLEIWVSVRCIRLRVIVLYVISRLGTIDMWRQCWF